MKKTVCDYCGEDVNFPTNREVTGDLDSRNLAVIKVEPMLLNETDSRIEFPDLCLECIIKVLRGKAV